MNVYLLWDITPAVKGEKPDLIAVCATEERAELEAALFFGTDEEVEVHAIEEVEVKD